MEVKRTPKKLRGGVRSFAPRLLLAAALLLLHGDWYVCLAAETAPSTTFRIDAKTKLQDVFKCSGIHFIGSFNEYYVACELHVPGQDALQLLEIVDATLDGAVLSPMQSVHTELSFQLNTSKTIVELRNSRVTASAVEFHAANISMDEHSAINVSACGLKFGPGFNSWFGMGGSYGGIGGASLTGHEAKCDDVPPNNFFRAVGDVAGDSANFRGYGSGGGHDQGRGGGRIRLVAAGNVEINGSLLANGGDACTSCYDSAGAGKLAFQVTQERRCTEANAVGGYMGPSSLLERDLFSLTLDGIDVAFSNALAMIHALDVTARGSLSVDKYSELKFRARVAVQTDASIKIDGFLQPLDKSLEPWRRDEPDDVPVVSLTSKKDVELRPQTVEMGALVLRIQAGGSGFVDMPFDTPFLSLSISATNVSIANVNSGPVLQCKAIEPQADPSACARLNGSTTEPQPYEVSVFASEMAMLGNISAGSMILCSDHDMTISGRISSSSQGCGSGVGPGRSEVAGEASGGAGHGGRGGNVLPGSTGGGAVYDTSTDLDLTTSVSWMTDKGWPIWPGSGAASGDSPNKVIGGNGGGIIYIGSKRLIVEKAAFLSARGGVGSKGGGGGSGGAMTLFISDISGGGVIDLAGGAATASAFPSKVAGGMNRSSIWEPEIAPSDINDEGKLGGGGGGGVIRITYRDTAEGSSAGNGEQFIKDGGELSVTGGESTGGENGGVGVMIGANCQPGRGGVFCLPCPEGSHSPDRFSKCTPCDPGTCSSQTGAATCSACPIGHFNPDFGKTECESCPFGSFGATTGLKKCVPCPPGAYSDISGSSKCALCPSGSITTSSGNRNCTVCGVGETTAKIGATSCLACTSKPVHSAFNMRGNCSYACAKGRNGLDCLTPFERLVKPIGGPLGFVILVFSLTGLVFGGWGFLSYRSSRSELRRYAEYKAQRLRDELSLATLTRNLTPRLTDQDLSAHVARLYFAGDNHLKNAWRLNPFFLPSSLREIVEEGTFASFAEKCNALLLWDSGGWEVWLFRVLLVLLPPVSTLFMRRRQLRRVEQLAQFIGQYGGRFFRDRNFRVHGTQLKLGFSPDFSLGYLDVLISPSASASSSNLAAMQTGSHRDLVLVVGGSGSFFRPYHLDTNDIIVRAIPSRLELLEHNFWIDFVAEMNQKLRVLPQPASVIRRVREAAEATRDILAFVAAFNEEHTRHGFSVTFGAFSIDSIVAAEANENCFTPFELDHVHETFELYPLDAFKLAFRVSRLATSPSGTKDEGLADAPTMDEAVVADEKLNIESDPRSAGFRYSQIRMEALFAQPERRSSAAGNSDDSSDESDDLVPLKKRRNSASSVRVEALMQFLCADHTIRRWLVALWQPVYPLFRLRNLPCPLLPARWLLPATMVLLLLADLGVAFWILMEYYCVQVRDPTAQDSGCSRTAVWSVLGILPAAIVGSPLLGLVFLVRKSVFSGKLFALWNASSIVNLLVAFLCGLGYLAYIHDGVLLVVIAGVGVKYLEKEVALRCIAQYASERPLRGWRGLHTTRDWYDAAYTPLVHHET
ncbi:hypothetical protein BBJ28_00000044 [Nothophytophthora sp. Chile5]|nr:hypothetical protein BBJ28_00000044 [Nothophytophthora sp. Chile5]